MKTRQSPGIPTNGDETRSVERSRTVELLALVAICIGYFMVILDATIVNVVAPILQTQLGTTRTAVQWVIDGYLLMFASLLLTAGALGDRLGNKQVFLAGFLLFTTASAFCGFAASIDILIAARFMEARRCGVPRPSFSGAAESDLRDTTRACKGDRGLGQRRRYRRRRRASCRGSAH